jgi:DtxR family Mn-dependent transcriptional regulator
MGGGHFQEFEEEYLETLYAFYEISPGKQVRNGELADILSVSPASATEMVQRLARKGFVEYEPYKGVRLTTTGLAFGQQMKRRHRLAESLLAILPFDGDIHETACRMEHAFNDDLEVCLTRILGNPLVDPSGKEIPSPSQLIQGRLESKEELVPISELREGEVGEVQIMLFIPPLLETIASSGMDVGTRISRGDDGYSIEGNHFKIAAELSSSIIVRRC